MNTCKTSPVPVPPDSQEAMADTPVKTEATTLSNKLKKTVKTMKEVMYGLMLHEMHMEINKDKARLNNLFMLVIFGDLVGLPLLPPYYSMRILPYIVPNIQRWKRTLLRERDLTDLGSVDL